MDQTASSAAIGIPAYRHGAGCGCTISLMLLDEMLDTRLALDRLPGLIARDHGLAQLPPIGELPPRSDGPRATVR